MSVEFLSPLPTAAQPARSPLLDAALPSRFKPAALPPWPPLPLVLPLPLFSSALSPPPQRSESTDALPSASKAPQRNETLATVCSMRFFIALALQAGKSHPLE